MIDTHAHLFSCERPIDESVQNAKNAGVSHIIHVATNPDNALLTLESSQRYPMVHPTVGIHPSEPHMYDRFDEIHTLAQQHPFVAIGETGLDYARQYAPAQDQRDNFIRHLELARELTLPVIIHNRHADDDIASILDRYRDVKKVIHCFSSPLDVAERVINENTFFSFTGMITTAKRGKTIHALRHIPLDHIMIETDCPYLIPEAFRGQENQPAFVGEIAKKIAEVKEISVDEVERATDQTARSFFKLP